MSHSSMHQKGFSLIALMIVLSMISALSVGILFGVRTAQQKGELDRAAAGTMELLRTAREQTLAAKDDDLWGLHLTGTSVAVFKGATFMSADDLFTLPPGVSAAWTILGGGDDIVFDRIEGTTSNAGLVTLTHAISGDSRFITILSSGEISAIGVLPGQFDTRITDTRHVHLGLTYDLSTATTLQLTFIDTPNVVEDITIADYVSAGVFTWVETIDVNGNPERIRLVSHALNPTTTLSVRRDRAVNTLALEMRVDGVLIASYSAAGVITPGAGVSVSIQ